MTKLIRELREGARLEAIAMSKTGFETAGSFLTPHASRLAPQGFF
jgi:hypothetical protein